MYIQYNRRRGFKRWGSHPCGTSCDYSASHNHEEGNPNGISCTSIRYTVGCPAGYGISRGKPHEMHVLYSFYVFLSCWLLSSSEVTVCLPWPVLCLFLYVLMLATSLFRSNVLPALTCSLLTYSFRFGYFALFLDTTLFPRKDFLPWRVFSFCFLFSCWLLALPKPQLSCIDVFSNFTFSSHVGYFALAK